MGAPQVLNNNLLQRIANRIESAGAKFVQKDDCWSPGSGQNQFPSVLVTIPPNADAAADVLVKLPRPAFGVMLASRGPSQATEEDSLFFHLDPLGNIYTGGTITPSGKEVWFEIQNADVPGTTYKAGSYLRFKFPIQQFYLDVGNESTYGISNPKYQTWIIIDDLEEFYLRSAGDRQG